MSTRHPEDLDGLRLHPPTPTSPSPSESHDSNMIVAPPPTPTSKPDSTGGEGLHRETTRFDKFVGAVRRSVARSSVLLRRSASTSTTTKDANNNDDDNGENNASAVTDSNKITFSNPFPPPPTLEGGEESGSNTTTTTDNNKDPPEFRAFKESDHYWAKRWAIEGTELDWHFMREANRRDGIRRSDMEKKRKQREKGERRMGRIFSEEEHEEFASFLKN